MISAVNAVVSRIGLYEAWQAPLTIAMAALAIAIARRPNNPLARLEALIQRIALRPYLSLAILIVAAIGGPLALRPFLGFPDPIIPDEFSLMLQAKTYLLGRLANPPLPPNFATDWVILDPTFASIYPVLRSFPLLIGYALGIGAWGGVVLSMAALVVAVYWMVSLWLGAAYAFVAALLVILRFGLFSLWVNSYWGGAFTALGGVLLLGGYAAVRSRPTIAAGALLGLGVFILMTTRPYEGLFLAAPLAVALAVHFVRSNAKIRKSLVVPGGVAAALVVAGFGLSFADNLATTGSWKLSPYVVFQETYGNPPALMPSKWERPASPDRYDWSRRSRDSDARSYERRASLHGVATAETFRFRNYWAFYIGFALLLPFLVGVWALRREPAILLSAASLALALAAGSYDFAHYAAPGFGLVILAVMLGFQALRAWRPGRFEIGLALSRTLPFALVLGAVIPIGAALFDTPQLPPPAAKYAEQACCWLRPRALHVSIHNEVRRMSDRNLVFVDTGPKAPRETLIANGPDVAGAESIWVNEDPEYNVATLRRYPGRRVWRLEWLDDGSPCLQLFQTEPSGVGASLSGDLEKLTGDPEKGWLSSRADCPLGLTHAPWVEP